MQRSASVSIMRLFASLLFFLLIASASAEPFVVIVRHAEKAAEAGNDPSLSPEGVARAETLATMLKSSKISSIFTTEFK